MHVTYIAILLLLAVFVRIIVRYVNLRHFSGPTGAGISEWLYVRNMLAANSHEWLANVHNKFGPIARVAPGLLVTSSPEVWSHVNKSPQYRRSGWFYKSLRFRSRVDTLFTEVNEKRHDAKRKQMISGYSGRDIRGLRGSSTRDPDSTAMELSGIDILDGSDNRGLEGPVDACVAEFLNLIRRKYLSTDQNARRMDIAEKVQFLTLDVISTLGFGSKFGMLENDEDIHDFIKSGAEGLRTINLIFALGLGWLVNAPVIGKYLHPSPGDRRGFGKMMGMCIEAADWHTNNLCSTRQDMLRSFIHHGVAGEDLRSAAIELVIAGSDTTATTIRTILLYVLTNQRVYGKLRREISEAEQDGRAPPAGEGIISFSQARNLPYLKAVVREGLRIRPSALALLVREVQPGGDTVVVAGKNVVLPQGARIGCSGYAMQRSTDVFGQDAGHFRPERWLQGEKDQVAAMEKTLDLVFSHGRFMCLGKNVAWMEIYKTIFEVLRNFDIALVDPERPWKSENCAGLFVISNMWVQVTARLS